MPATVRQISISKGGVPKLPVVEAIVTETGIEGDRQNDTKHHGGPTRALCLFSWDLIQRLRAEGHPIQPGTVGENLTIEGVAWESVAPGTRFLFSGGVELEVLTYTKPCATIRDSFKDLEFRRIMQDLHPGHSRVYARVITPGRIVTGESVQMAGVGFEASAQAS